MLSEIGCDTLNEFPCPPTRASQGNAGSWSTCLDMVLFERVSPHWFVSSHRTRAAHSKLAKVTELLPSADSPLLVVRTPKRESGSPLCADVVISRCLCLSFGLVSSRKSFFFQLFRRLNTDPRAVPLWNVFSLPPGSPLTTMSPWASLSAPSSACNNKQQQQ